MRVNAATREVACKIVYYGPGMSGKTTNLKIIHDRSPRQQVGEIVTLDTHSERTLHFDLLPIDIGEVNGWRVRFEFYTVPGQSYYAATRRLVLEGADAVVFVADSRREALDENIDSMNDLLDNLRHHQLQQDLPTALRPEQLDPLLNIRRWQSFAAVAANGVGVMETMKSVGALLTDRVRREPALGHQASAEQPMDPAALPASPAPARSWLITCHRCLNMLETVGAKVGDLYTCGACGTSLEIIDLEHGITRTPRQKAQPQPPSPALAPGPASAPPPRPTPQGRQAASYSPASGAQALPGQMPPGRAPSGSQPILVGGRPDESQYGMQTLPATPAAALGIAPSGASPTVAEGPAFEVEGYDQVALLDENVQGRRFRVRERATGRPLRALVLSPMLVRQPNYFQQVEPYARLAAQVQHPNVLPLTALRQGRETPVLLSTDPQDHESLAHVLARRRTLAPPHAVGVIRQAALALEEASRHGVVHGWLRPDVILLSPDGNVLLDELAVPKHHRFLVRELSGASASTEYYLAPEHLSDEVRSDARSDMFLLGALLFRMLTGEGLVTGYSAHEALHRVAATGCRTLRSVQPNISRDLDGFCARLTASDRKDRYATYKEVVELCDRFGGGARRPTLKLTQAHPVTTSQRHAPRTASGIGSGSAGRPATSRPPGSTAAARRIAPVYGPAATPSSHARQRSDGSSAGTWVVVTVLLLAVAAAAIYASGRGRGSAQKPPATQPPATAPTVPQRSERPPTPPPLVATGGAGAGPKGGEVEKVPAQPRPAEIPRPVADEQPQPVQPQPTQPVAQAQPQQPLAVQDSPLRLGGGSTPVDILFGVAQLEREHRYRQALLAAERLGDPEARGERRRMVEAAHRARRDELAAQVRSMSPADARTLVEREVALWEMPGDKEWAEDALRAAGTGGHAPQPPAAQQPAAQQPAAQQQPAQPQPRPPAPGVQQAPTDPSQADAAVNRALIEVSPLRVEPALANIDRASAEYRAIRRKVDIWSTRDQVIRAAVSEKRATLRVSHPVQAGQWDVVGADAEGLQVQDPSGTGTLIPWTQVRTADLVRICQEIAREPSAKPREHALAAIMSLIGGDIVRARFQLRLAKGVLDAELLGDIDILINLHVARAGSDLVARAEVAARTGDAKALGEVLAQMRLAENAALPEVAAALPRVEEYQRRLAEGRNSAGVAIKDRCTFDAAEDLQSFQSVGTWTVAGGQARPSGDSAALSRKDGAGARSLTLLFQTDAERGGLVVGFRGIRVVIDFARGTIMARTPEDENKPVEFKFLPRTIHTLHLETRASGLAAVEINNGVKVFDLRLPVPNDQIQIAVDTGAVVGLDEVQIRREQKTGPAKPDPADEKRIADIRALGLEPIGKARLQPPAIVLPAGETRSGVALQLRDGLVGCSFGVRGKGALRLHLGQLGRGDGPRYDLQLADGVDAQCVVRWDGGQLRVSVDGVEVGKTPHTGGYQHFMIVAMQEATILSTPRLERQ